VIGANIVVTYQGGPDSGALATTKPLAATSNGVAFTTDFGSTIKVGDTATTAHSTTAGAKDHVVVVATFTDGTVQVILDTQI
jgi:archaeal type IV pilus assembly protein PilA